MQNQINEINPTNQINQGYHPNPVNIVLPKSYDLVVGDTFQLFYRGIIEAVNPFAYDILAICEKGRNYPRYFECTETEEGDYPLTIQVCDNRKNILAEETTMLKVRTAKHAPEKPLNILCVGDSLTAGGIWVEEVHRRLTARDGEPQGLGLEGFRFIGSCKRGEVSFVGYGGWMWDNYLSYDDNSYSAIWVSCNHQKTAQDQHSVWVDESGHFWQLETIEEDRLKFTRLGNHTFPKPKEASWLLHHANAVNTESIIIQAASYETPNPFWNEALGKVDFQAFCAKNHDEGIDAAYFFLSWNGMFENTLPIPVFCQNMVSKAKALTDILHNQYPNVKIKIMGLQIPSIHGGTGASYGAKLPYCDDYGLVRFVMELNRQYAAWAEEEAYKDYVEFINISGQFDSDYNMPWQYKPVNTRSSLTERIGTNGVHPSKEGYLQIADAVFRNIVNQFCR